MTAAEALNKILEDGIMAQSGDADEIIAALEHYGFKILKFDKRDAPPIVYDD